MEYEPVIGLEIHVQLRTRSKMFCSCPADYQTAPPNTRVCAVCLALPGSLPVINRRAVEFTMMAGLALNCEIAATTKFDRKNYGYPDLMKGYQISQYDQPIAIGGHLDLPPSEHLPEAHRVGITRVHLEEDVARMVHVGHGPGSYALIDVNRAGVPLMEVVSEPDIFSPAQAEAYITELQSTMRYLGVSTANMEEGSFRCDANVSVRPRGSKILGRRVEIKNMNRVRAVVRALDYEIERQVAEIEAGRTIVQETRGWLDAEGMTTSQRSKEEANDYRYFPEPDLPPVDIPPEWVESTRASLPELGTSRRARFQADYGLSPYDAALLTAKREIAEYYEQVLATRSLSGAALPAFAKEVANWINVEVARLLNLRPVERRELSADSLSPEHLATLVEMFQTRKINNHVAKQVLEQVLETHEDPRSIVEAQGLAQVSGTDALAPVVEQVLSKNEKAVSDYLEGKETAIRFLVGQVMKSTRGAADPNLAAQLITEKLAVTRSVQ